MPTDQLYTTLDAMLKTEITKKNTHRILLGVQSGDKQVDYRGAAGDITASDPYFIASITKLMTASVIMQLVDAGQIQLDALITDYLPDDLTDGIHVFKGADYSKQLKVYQLLHQTSGLADYFLGKRADGSSVISDISAGKDTLWTLPEAIEKARQLDPKFEPDASNGKKSHYSDTNYQLLGAIIERVTGQSIAENFRVRIFEPLNMRDSYLYNCATPRDGKQPMNFYNEETELIIPRAMTSFGVDGGVVSTLDDMLIFLRAYMDNALFNSKHNARMRAQWNTVFFPIQYGYGVMRFQLPRIMTLFQYSPELIGHSGASSSFAFYAPKEDVFLIGTFNQIDAQNRPFQFMLKVINAVTKSR